MTDRVEVLRGDFASSDNTNSSRATLFVLLDQLEGRFQIPNHIPTSRFAVGPSVDALYVHRMYRYVSGLTDSLAIPLCILIVDDPALRRQPRQEKLPSSLQARFWYRQSKLLGHFVLYSYYAGLRVGRSDEAAESSHPRVDTSTFLNIAASHFPLPPVLFSDYPLTPDICVQGRCSFCTSQHKLKNFLLNSIRL